jgi:hypothetical protein
MDVAPFLIEAAVPAVTARHTCNLIFTSIRTKLVNGRLQIAGEPRVATQTHTIAESNQFRHPVDLCFGWFLCNGTDVQAKSHCPTGILTSDIGITRLPNSPVA